ncbi:Metallo-dependent phosphatase-like protein [Zychaea mexicana]|uniref:Metallo-dependent phosphatase-like protein n=1 Tax=Zychaea mexicana TaxID=64656 RepID=UPI0022FEA800|nr:Metallo-dependent phosphatase-like protein [Zychaea mexicana]KAI9487936.1 Metallo-dependent phosphatase-like protein [Zychaea mexicana]
MIHATDSLDYLKEKEPHACRFVCVSDTHGRLNFSFPIPDGDVFVHAGDLTRVSSYDEFERTIAWIESLPHKIKIVTAGNHDHVLDDKFGFVKDKQQFLARMDHANITYLEHESFRLPQSLGRHKMFVSPYAPFHIGGAFMLHSLRNIWEAIPEDIDILVTHTPPFGYQDRIARGGQHVGCPHLRTKVEAIRPRVHIFGHIHEDHGWQYTPNGATLMINACICDRRYRASQRPVVFDI